MRKQIKRNDTPMGEQEGSYPYTKISGVVFDFGVLFDDNDDQDDVKH